MPNDITRKTKELISHEAKEEIKEIWDAYVAKDKIVKDTKGNEVPNIDESRLECIPEIRDIIEQFLDGSINISEFKTSLDSYNKRNNLWGFTSIKGQMFFNQLVKNNENRIDEVETILKNTISEPSDLEDALNRILLLEEFTQEQYDKADDRRKVANPGSVGYYLSYFWQIHDHKKWPIMYTSQINSFKELGIWEDHQSQKENYKYFYYLNEHVKDILEEHTHKHISNWEAEHAFWNYNGHPQAEGGSNEEKTIATKDDSDVNLQPGFELSDFLIPKIASLVEVGGASEKSASERGSKYEKTVAEIFRYLNFEVEFLGQGRGRNPDAILRYRRENIAFLVDAKAYTSGYSLGIDDRAIREYINYYCPRLEEEGFRKIGFIIVSNSFNSSFDSFINDITWNTKIRRFVLLSSRALLYLFAYKMKDNLSLDIIVDKIIGCGNLIEASDIIEEFEDV